MHSTDPTRAIVFVLILMPLGTAFVIWAVLGITKARSRLRFRKKPGFWKTSW